MSKYVSTFIILFLFGFMAVPFTVRADDQESLLDTMLSMEKEETPSTIEAPTTTDTPETEETPESKKAPEEIKEPIAPQREIHSEDDFLSEMLSVQDKPATAPDQTDSRKAPEDVPVIAEDTAPKKETESMPSTPEAHQTSEEPTQKDAQPSPSKTEEKPEEKTSIVDKQDNITPQNVFPDTGALPLKDFSAGMMSIMYHSNEYQQLQKAIAAYAKKHRGKTVTSTNATGVVIQERAPVFFLNSLVYISDDDWAIWLNHAKYTKNSPTKDIEVIRVSRDTVYLAWTPPSLASLSSWQHQFKQISSSEYVSPEEDVTINLAEKKVYFSLQPNQTFDTRAMRVREGLLRGTILTSSPIVFNNQP